MMHIFKVVIVIAMSITSLTSMAQQRESIDSVASKKAIDAEKVLQKRLDSLNAIRGRIFVLKEKLQKAQDSARSLEGIQDSVVQKNLALLRTNADSTQQYFGKVEAELNASLARLKSMEDGLIQNINGKVSSLQYKISSVGKLDGSPLNTGQLPLVTENFPINGMEIPGDILKVDLPDDLVSNNMASVSDIQEISLPINEIKVPDLPSIEVESVTKYATSLPKIDNIEQKSIEMLSDNVSEFDGLTDMIDEADKAKRYYDPEVIKEDMITKAKQEAVNHFAGHEEELKAAMQKLADVKAKFPYSDAVLDAFAKKQNVMKQKPFSERLRPGFTFQFQRANGSYLLDLNPNIAYQFAYRWSAGFGWVERIAYDFESWGWDASQHTYGPRGFVNFKLKENLWLRAEAEILKSPAVRPIQLTDPKQENWAPNYFVGMKKDIRVSKKIMTTLQLCYGLKRPSESLYVNRFNTRIGIEWVVPSAKIKAQNKPVVQK